MLIEPFSAPTRLTIRPAHTCDHPPLSHRPTGLEAVLSLGIWGSIGGKGLNWRTRGWAVPWGEARDYRSLVTWASSSSSIPSIPVGLCRRNLINGRVNRTTFN